MENSEDAYKDIRAFWNGRAGLGPMAGSQDLNLKQLEMDAISSYVRDGMRILEVGCGNGITAITIAKKFQVRISGIDYAEEMISSANSLLAGEKIKGTIEFKVGDALQLFGISDRFDLIYTERVLINLLDWESQVKAISDICGLLKPGGAYVMCENSRNGLDALNGMRMSAGLPEIKPPWHNRYMQEAEINALRIPGVILEEVRDFTSTYYFISRVINAWQASQEGKEPDYNAPVNRLAFKLPPIGSVGQGKIWIWRKSI
jgi:ubiquinone/menaquinone biosynthesis C-methylase UbiE